MKGVIKEFQEFAVKGNVIDLAVGVVIGGAFGHIVTSLVNDIIMPPIGLLLGGTDFSNLRLIIQEATAGEAAIAINYGAFITTVLDFVIIAFAIFVVVKQMNRLKKKEEAKPPEKTPEDIELLREIRDALKK